jgi:CRP-like cAMP-binding protein
MNNPCFESIRFFSELTDAEKSLLISIAKQETIPKNQVLAREGEEGDEVFALLKGRVSVEVSRPAWESTKSVSRLSSLDTGELFGEMVLVGKRLRVATIRTVEEVQIAVWSTQALFECFNKNPRLGYKFMLALARHLGDRLESANMALRRSAA